MTPIEPLSVAPSSGYATWAQRYLDAGWRGVVPLPEGQKWPPPKGYTGASAPDPTGAQVAAWEQSGQYRGGNLALRLPSNVIVFDVDDHDGKRAAETICALESAAGIALPDTWTSTSRDDGSAHWFYRVPELPDGERWPSNLLPFGEGVEVLHRGHRYAVVYPSTNPANEGKQYRWRRPDGALAEVGEIPSPDDLTPLPGAFLDVLTAPRTRNAEKASEADARGFLDRLATRDDYRQPMSERVARVVSEAIVHFPQSGHDAMVTAQGRILRYAEKGDPGLSIALDLLRAGFIAAVADRYSGRDSRGDGEAAAARDFDAAWAGAAREVAGDLTPDYVHTAFELGGRWHPDTPGGVYARMGWGNPIEANSGGQANAPAPIFRLMGASDWAKPVPPPQFMVRGILVRDTFGVVAGPKKSLKTHENHALALAVATGQPLYNHDQFSVSRSGRVLYIVGEGGQADIQRKLQRMCRTYGVDPNDVARDPQFPLKVAFGAAPLSDPRMNDQLKVMLDDAQPDLVLIESFYNFHPEGVEAGNLYQRGQAIDGFHKLVRSECEGATSLMTDHYRSTAGKGNDLDMISMAGQAEVADSWITRHPYADADVDAGEFHLRVAYGSRQWGGREYDIDWHLGRFNEDTGSHEGTDGDDRITWTIAPSGEGTATDKKGGGARGLSESALIDTELLRRIANHSGVSKDECCRAVAEIIKTRKAAVSDRFDTLAAVHRIKAELVEYTKSNGRKDKRNGWFVSDEATNLVVNRADLSDV